MPVQKTKVALQLYSIKEIAERDFFQALNIAKQVGYDGVEFAGFYGKEAVETKQYLDNLQLLPAGVHAGLNAVVDKFSETMEYNAAIENKYVVVPHVPEEFRSGDGMKKLAQYLNQASEDAKQYGIKIGYHNHAYDFGIKDEGEYLFDILAANTVDDIVLEIDTFWAKKGGVDVVQYCKKYKNRLNLVHFKDMNEDGEDTEIGSGSIDFPGILAVTDAIEWCVMEQEKFRMPMEQSIAISCEYMHNIIDDTFKI